MENGFRMLILASLNIFTRHCVVYVLKGERHVCYVLLRSYLDLNSTDIYHLATEPLIYPTQRSVVEILFHGGVIG